MYRQISSLTGLYVLQLNSLRHTQDKSDFYHQEHDRGASVADKGQRYPCIGYRIGYNGNIQDYLYGNMAHNAHNEQRPE